MPLPYLNAPEQSIDMISQFGGYNHRVSIAENQFFDMTNMSAKDYPLASTRKKRGIISNGNLNNAQTLTAKDNLLFAYTGYGDIGVTIVSDVAANPWKDPITNDDAVDGFATLYSTVCEYNSNALTESILTSTKNVSNFGRYIFKNNTMSSASGKTPVIDGTTVKVEWEHEAIPKGTLWAKELFEIGHWYSLDKAKVSAETNAFLNSAENRKLLLGKTVYLNGTTAITIKSIEESKKLTLYYHDDWIIEFSKEFDNDDCEGKSVYVRLTEPLAAEIPAGIYTQTKTDGEVEEINLPSTVEVKAASDMHIKVLKGQTVTFIDENGRHPCVVSDYSIEGGKKYLKLECPHDAIAANATAQGDRLYLCELNPFTNESVTSDIFAASPKPHTILEMGANVVIFPEKVMVNTQKKNLEGQFDEIQQLELTEVATEVTLKMIDANGDEITDCEVGNTAPEEPSNGTAWIDTTDSPPSLKIYSSQIEQWAKTQAYCSLESSGLNDWQVGDAVELEFDEADIIGDVIVPAKDQKYFVLSAVKEGEYIRFPIAMKASSKSVASVIIKRTIPEMDFVIENENRLWGCKYGEVDGEPINEIFACKLGDPTNWHHFTNTSIDSYYVSLGADGEFTGAISYAGNPFFFREGCIHRIYGNYPSNYALKTINCHGVEKGSEKGIAVMNDVMYYKSPVGIMAYTGATPVNISECFGTERYKNAVAGAVGSKMYFSMQDSNGNNVLFTYDDNTKLWHKEDTLRCKEMVAYENEVYALSEYNQVVAMEGGAGAAEEDFEWNLTSGSIGFLTPFYKRLARLNLRLLMERKTKASIYIQYDSDGNWHHVTNLQPTGMVRSISVPITPHRCDHFALKIAGKGDCKILSITKFVEEGSEIE